MELSRTVGDRVYLLGHEAFLGRSTWRSAISPLPRPGCARSPTSFLGLGRRPSFQGIATDTVEALLGAGDLDEAASLLAEVGSRYTDPITAAAAARCRGLLAAHAATPVGGGRTHARAGAAGPDDSPAGRTGPER